MSTSYQGTPYGAADTSTPGDVRCDAAPNPSHNDASHDWTDLFDELDFPLYGNPAQQSQQQNSAYEPPSTTFSSTTTPDLPGVDASGLDSTHETPLFGMADSFDSTGVSQQSQLQDSAYEPPSANFSSMATPDLIWADGTGSGLDSSYETPVFAMADSFGNKVVSPALMFPPAPGASPERTHLNSFTAMPYPSVSPEVAHLSSCTVMPRQLDNSISSGHPAVHQPSSHVHHKSPTIGDTGVKKIPKLKGRRKSKKPLPDLDPKSAQTEEERKRMANTLAARASRDRKETVRDFLETENTMLKKYIRECGLSLPDGVTPLEEPASAGK